MAGPIYRRGSQRIGRVLDRDEIPAVLAVSALDVLGRLPARLFQLGAQLVDLGFELENPTDSLEVEPRGRQVLNAA